MKLNWAERWVVNNPSRVLQQRAEIRWMKKAMPLAPDSVVLEIGCGRGAGAALILKEFEPGVLHAMDLDEAMLRKAAKYLSSAQKNKISLFTGDVMHLPYGDESLDAVFGFGVLHHVPDWRGALREISRVLRVGGVYFLEEIYPHIYQNFITRHILLHPREDRFFSRQLKEGLTATQLDLKQVFEINLVGILGVCTKSG